jgi:hypothetical protein
MNTLLKTAAIVIGLTGATLAGICTASAHDYDHDQSNSGFSFSFGDVQFGYRDGYWDHQHRWHNWQHPEDRRRYRTEHRSDYHHWDHTRDRNQGWYDQDRRNR